MRTLLFGFMLSLLSLFVSFPARTQENDEVLWEKARRIHDEALVIDAHAHAQLFSAPSPNDLDLGDPAGNSQIDFVTMKQGGLDAVFMVMPLRGEADRQNPSKGIIESIERVRRQIDQYSDLAEIALSPSDVEKIHRDGKRAILLTVEFPEHLEGRIETLELLYKHGIRSLTMTTDQLTRLEPSDIRGPAKDELSAFGRAIVKEMNRLGMLIDITHTPDNLQLEIVKASNTPVVASHSCVRGIHDKPRNIPDAILKEIAKRGGVVGITFASAHISKAYTEKRRKAEAEYEVAKAKLENELEGDKDELERKRVDLRSKLFPERVSIDLLIDHIDYAVKVAGIDHIGLGSDFGGIENPIGLETAAGFSLITYHLLKRGYGEEDIKKILGGNLLRVFKEVQRATT